MKITVISVKGPLCVNKNNGCNGLREFYWQQEKITIDQSDEQKKKKKKKKKIVTKNNE